MFFSWVRRHTHEICTNIHFPLFLYTSLNIVKPFFFIGCSEELLTDKENQHFLFKEPVRLCPEHPREDTFLMKMREALELEHRPGQTLISSAKIKLQLFPVNEEIRTGLEKVVCST